MTTRKDRTRKRKSNRKRTRICTVQMYPEIHAMLSTLATSDDRGFGGELAWLVKEEFEKRRSHEKLEA